MLKLKKLSKLLILVLAAAMLLSVPALAAEPSVTAGAAIVMDYDTGEVLYAKDIDTMRVPASMTKIMTAYIIYEELEAGTITKDSRFTISDSVREKSRDNYNYPTSVPLVGDTIDVDTLLKLIMIPSASASCICAAENISGSEEAFVARMNETAKRLGMKAEYENSHGAFVHYISCRSIAILIRDFISRYPDILNYTSLKSVEYNGKTYSNTNKLLSTYYYEGVDGFKTGTISAAGYCLSATAARDGRRIITVVMNSRSTEARHTDSQKLLDYGFAEVGRRDAARLSANISLSSANPLRVGADVNVTAGFSGITAPFEGTFTFTIDGNIVKTYTGEVSNSTKITSPVNLDESYLGKDTAEAAASFSLPDGTERTFRTQLTVNGEAAASFSDIAYHWAEGDISALKDKGIISGNPDGTFTPNNSISRAEFAQMAYSAFRQQLRHIPADPKISFTDIQGHWAEEAVTYLAQRSIVFGWDGNFSPDAPISRQEAIVILARILAPEDGPSAELAFTDSADISDWAVNDVAAFYSLGFINGDPGGTFRPLADISKAESAAIVNRAL